MLEFGNNEAFETPREDTAVGFEVATLQQNNKADKSLKDLEYERKV